MNLEREREIFIDWHFNKYYAKDADKEFLYEMFKDKNEFVSYEVQHSWVAWLASANQDGYKLVPVSFLKDINSVAVDEFHKWKIKEEQMPAICEYMQDLSFYIGVEK